MADSPQNVTILALSGTSMMTLASIMDPLRAANRVSRQPVFKWQVVSPTGAPITLSNGIEVAADAALHNAAKAELFVVVAGFNHDQEIPTRYLSQVRRTAAMCSTLFSVEAGAWVLARAEVLRGQTVTTHWEDLENFQFAYPNLNPVNQRFVVDGKVWSSGGASPTLDMLLHYLRTTQRQSLALDVANVFIYSESERADEASIVPSLNWLDRVEPRLAHALRVMDSQHEAPLATHQIAKLIGVSPRTLELLMRSHLNTSPHAYYLRSRLQEARRLVLDSQSSMLEIALRTGFSNPSSFSRAFKQRYQVTPIQLRNSAKTVNIDRPESKNILT